MNLASWLFQTANSWPTRPAIYYGTELFCTYRQLSNRAASLANGLQQYHAVQAGDRVAIFCANCPEYLEILHAVWWLGAVVVPINYKLHQKEADYILKHSGTRVIFTDSGELFDDCDEISIQSENYAELVGRANSLPKPKAVTSETPAWLFYTSGTTGRPKGVVLTHDILMHMALCYGTDVDQPNASSVSLYAAPMSHGAGLYSLPFIREGSAHLVPKSRSFDPSEIIALAGNPGQLCFFAAPTMVKRLVLAARKSGFNGDGLQTIVYGGGPMYGADLDEALDTFGAKFVQIYGQGESPMTITALSRELVADETHPNWRSRRVSVGIAQSCVDAAVVDRDGNRVAIGKTGEVVVRGPTVMKGYWGDPEATKAAINDGWLRTGDLGQLDVDGFLSLTDRSKDVIISGGSNIYPREVEEVLLAHPDVSEVAVVGAKDDDWGEIVVAFVVGIKGADLGAWCVDQIASFKKPKRYIYLPDLPKNSYGKVLKTELRKMV